MITGINIKYTTSSHTGSCLCRTNFVKSPFVVARKVEMFSESAS